MTTNWLKAIGTVELPWPDRPYDDRGYVEFRGKKPRQIHRADRMVLYAVGGSKCVFALVEVTSEVEDSGQEAWPYLVKIRTVMNLRPSCGVSIDKIRHERDLLRAVRAQHSYIKLTPKEYEVAEAQLRQAEAQLRQEEEQV
jgi:hypothetical protein